MNLNTNHPPQSRVPGAVQKTKEYALGKDLTKLSRRELLDLKSRQQKLLENKFVIEFRNLMNFVLSVDFLVLEVVFKSFPTKGKRSRSCMTEL